MIVAAPEILSDQWMLIGRQETTDGGGRADLIAIAPDASLILIELKRDKTPRDVIAQTLDYASSQTSCGASEHSAASRASWTGNCAARLRRRVRAGALIACCG